MPSLAQAKAAVTALPPKEIGIVARHGLLVAGRDLVGEEGHVDIGLADEQCLHDADRSRKRRFEQYRGRRQGSTGRGPSWAVPQRTVRIVLC